MNSSHNCPICKNILTDDDAFDKIYQDLSCRSNKNHFYGIRLKNNETIVIKYRFSENNINFHTKIDFESNNLVIWRRPGLSKNFLQTTENIKLDFSNVEKLNRKIKTYLLFS